MVDGPRRWSAPPCALPQVPHRLLTLTLLPGLELCLLCGPRPSLSQLDAQVNRPLPYDTFYFLALGHQPLVSSRREPLFSGPFPSLMPRPLWRALQSPPQFTHSPSAWVFPGSAPPIPFVPLAPPPLTTPPTASGALVATPAGPTAGLPATGLASAARWLPAAHRHPRVGLCRERVSGPHPLFPGLYTPFPYRLLLLHLELKRCLFTVEPLGDKGD